MGAHKKKKQKPPNKPTNPPSARGWGNQTANTNLIATCSGWTKKKPNQKRARDVYQAEQPGKLHLQHLENNHRPCLTFRIICMTEFQ